MSRSITYDYIQRTWVEPSLGETSPAIINSLGNKETSPEGVERQSWLTGRAYSTTGAACASTSRERSTRACMLELWLREV